MAPIVLAMQYFQTRMQFQTQPALIETHSKILSTIMRRAAEG
jgi:hypothetical protein